MKRKKQKPMGRGAGILLPVASLPSPYGIGTFGKEAYDFIDFLKAAGQKYWQVLPLGPTGYGDSPYQSFSAFAGNPYFIDFRILEHQGLLMSEEYQSVFKGENPQKVDYEFLYQNRFLVLKKAFERFEETEDYRNFCREEEYWLEDYAFFMALKGHFGGAPWQEWEEDIRLRTPKALRKYRGLLKRETDFYKFCQYEFFCQWNELKAYAQRKKIQIVGDIPIYAAMDSADVWAESELFQLDEKHRPTRVAGVPPDLFSDKGQLWGNPLYDWGKMERQDFSWWRKRISRCASLYDVIRIDHFVGIAHYYSIPAGEETAENGVWIEGPGRKLLKAISEAVGKKKIIAEDLGEGTADMFRMMKEYGYPGMKLMEFAFDCGSKNGYLPHNFERNCVVYGGTHDNEPLAEFFACQSRSVCKFAREYLGVSKNREIPWGIIRLAYGSVADTVIFQLQDILGLGGESRMNTPSTLGGNWEWRMTSQMLSKELAKKLKTLSVRYGRAE